jgi:predicted ester cyclase
MSVERNKNVIRQLFAEVMNGGRVEVLDSLCTPDFSIESPVISSEVARQDSLGAFKRGVAAFHAAFPGLNYESHYLLGDGENVSVDYVLHGTHTGPFAGIAPTGNKITSTQLCFAELSEGRIRRLRFCSYGTPLLAQLQS